MNDGCPANCKYIALARNIFYCTKYNLRVTMCKYCINYAPKEDDDEEIITICPKCHNPASGYCYTCGVHIR